MGFWAAAIPAAIGAAASLIGGKQDRDSASELNAYNTAYQKEFAQQGIRWRVADAKAAGLHPLAALGMNPAQFSPVTAMGESGIPEAGRYMADMGQNIMRAAYAKATPQERELAMLKLEQERARLRNMNLQNLGLLKELQDINSSPPLTLDQKVHGVGQDAVEYKKPEVALMESQGIEAGLNAMEINTIDKEGFLAQLPGPKTQEAMENAWVANLQYNLPRAWKWLKGGFVTEFALSTKWGREFRKSLREERSKLTPLPKGYEWRYNVERGQWRKVAHGGVHHLFDEKHLWTHD